MSCVTETPVKNVLSLEVPEGRGSEASRHNGDGKVQDGAKLDIYKGNSVAFGKMLRTNNYIMHYIAALGILL